MRRAVAADGPLYGDRLWESIQALKATLWKRGARLGGAARPTAAPGVSGVSLPTPRGPAVHQPFQLPPVADRFHSPAPSWGLPVEIQLRYVETVKLISPEKSGELQETRLGRGEKTNKAPQANQNPPPTKMNNNKRIVFDN